MSPVLGIIASSTQQGRGDGPVGSYDALASVVIPSNLSEFTFVSIPAGYEHLQIRVVAKTTRPTYNNDLISLRFNGDTSTSYSSHHVKGTGTGTASTESAAAINKIYLCGNVGDTVNASENFGVAIIDIYDYANTTRNKTMRSLSGYDANGTGTDPGIVSLSSGFWNNTSAITTITLLPGEGSALASQSIFSLYGVK